MCGRHLQFDGVRTDARGLCTMSDGLGPVLRGGLEKSDVERTIRILEVVTQRVESVLRWVKAPDSTPANRGNRLVVRFCGVVYRDRDISHPICGGEYRGEEAQVGTSMLAGVSTIVSCLGAGCAQPWVLSAEGGCSSVYSVRWSQRGVRTTRLPSPILKSYSGSSPRRCWIWMVKHAVARTSGLHH